jgi:hypothetical protein
MKVVKNIFKKGGGQGGRNNNRGCEFDQSTLYTYMEIS